MQLSLRQGYRSFGCGKNSILHLQVPIWLQPGRVSLDHFGWNCCGILFDQDIAIFYGITSLNIHDLTTPPVSQVSVGHWSACTEPEESTVSVRVDSVTIPVPVSADAFKLL
jgi:hypothetical protein